MIDSGGDPGGQSPSRERIGLTSGRPPALREREVERPGPLGVEHLSQRLKEHTIRGVSATSTVKVLKFLMQLGSIPLLARLLTPADFGLVAMVTVATSLFSRFNDLGLSTATVQVPQLTHEQLSTLFWINSGIGLTLTLLVAAFSPLLAHLYNEPRLIPITVAIATSFVLAGIAVQHSALLKRQMRFGVLARAELVSAITGVLSGVIGAWAGWEHWALVAMTIATQLSATVQILLASRWRPSLPRRNSGVRPLLKFGLHVTSANIIGHFAANMTPFLVGMVGGAQQLGLFNRANTLSAVPSSQILTPVVEVAQPALARVAGEPARFRNASLSIIRKVGLITMFVTVLLVAMADWIVAVFLGPGWEGATPMFRLLAIFTLIEPIAALCATMLIAAGKAGELLRWKAIALAIISCSLAIGSTWGIQGMVAGYALSGLFIRLPLLLAYSAQHLPVTTGDLMRSMFPSLSIAATLLLVLEFLRSQFILPSPYHGLVVYTLLGSCIYVAGALAIKSARIELVEIYELVTKFVKYHPSGRRAGESAATPTA